MPTRDRGGVSVDPSARAYIYVYIYIYIVANVPHIFICLDIQTHMTCMESLGIMEYRFFFKSTLPDYTLARSTYNVYVDLHYPTFIYHLIHLDSDHHHTISRCT